MAAEDIEGRVFHSYNLTVGVMVNMDDLIYTIAPQDLPLFAGVGANGLAVLPRIPVNNRVFSWMEDEVPLPRGTTAEALDAVETVIDMVTGDAVKFAAGDIIYIDAEYMQVTDIDVAAVPNTVTVTRAALGSVAATHVTASDVVGLGTVLTEGEIGVANFRGREEFDNYTQIFSKSLEVTRTEQQIRKYGVPNELNKQVRDATHSISVAMEQAALYQKKWQDSATQKRATGGLFSFITTNVDAATDWITVEEIQQAQQSSWDRGGSFDIVMARPAAFGALTNLTGTERVTQVSIDDTRRGRAVALSVMTEFGTVTLVRNRWMRATDAAGYTRENFIARVMQPLVMQRLAKTKDTDSYMMVAELGFEVKGQRHMHKWTGLDPSASLPTGLI